MKKIIYILSHYLFPLTVITYSLLLILNINLPPNGYHQWRESDTAAICLNYHQESMNFTEPRINQRGTSSGITGSELPIYNYSTAILYSLFGVSHAIPRILTLLAALIGLIILYKIVLLFSTKLTASLAVWAMAFSPLFYFYGYKIMPDIWMLMFLLLAIWFFIRTDNKTLKTYLVSGLFLVLSATIKPLGLSIYLPFLLLWISNKERNIKSGISLFLFIVITFVLTLGWYLYARKINDIHGTPGFYLGENLVNFSDFFFKAEFFKKQFLQWPFELWLGWVLVLPFILGIWYTRKRKDWRFIFWWLLSVYIVFIPTAQHSSSHDYYTLVIIPPLAVLTGFGLSYMINSKRWLQVIAFLLIIGSPINAYLRVMHRIADVPEFDKVRIDAENVIPQADLVMVEDNTMAIRLYQLNRHGWPLRFQVTPEAVKNLISNGAQWLVLEKSIENYEKRIIELVEPNEIKLGKLYCYKTKVEMDNL